MSSTARESFGHLAKPDKPRRKMPRWFIYLFVAPLVAVVGLFVLAIIVAAIQLANMSPEERARWDKEQEERALVDKINRKLNELPKLDKGQFIVQSRDYGDDWPFTAFTSGVVTCKVEEVGSYNGQQATRAVVTIKLGDTVYGLNGAAMGAGGYPDPKPWRKRNEWGYFEVGVSEIDSWIKRALANCHP